MLLSAAIWIFFAAAEITKQDVAVEEVFRRSADIESRIADLEREIPPRPEFKPTETDEKKYNDLVGKFTEKSNTFEDTLNEVNQIIRRKVSRGHEQ